MDKEETSHILASLPQANLLKTIRSKRLYNRIRCRKFGKGGEFYFHFKNTNDAIIGI